MKKSLCLVLALMTLALAVLPLAFASADSVMYVKTANGKALNVRSEAKTGDNVIGYLKYGEKVIVVKYSANGKWAQIEKASGSDLAWVMSAYLVPTNPGKYKKAETAATTSDDTYSSFRLLDEEAYSAYTKPSKNGGFVSLRWAPSKSAPVMKNLFADEELMVIAEGKSWLQVQELSTGYVGFVDAKLVRENK